MISPSRIALMAFACALALPGAALAEARPAPVSPAQASAAQASRTSVPVTDARPVSAGPVVSTRPTDGPPNGIPPELHRKVVHLYKRLHNAHPNATRKQIFLRIARILQIQPRRLWNAYHNYHDSTRDGPLVIDRVPHDTVQDRPSDRVRDQRARDRVADRPRRDRVRDHGRDRRIIRDGARRARPVRPGRRGG